MAATRLRLSSLKLLHKYNVPVNYSLKKSLCSAKNPENEELDNEKKSGFAKFDEKQADLLNEELDNEKKSGFAKFDEKQANLLKEHEPPSERDESFVSLLKNCNFIAMGNPVGKVVVGQIYHVVGKDLYIDFGWKFPTVCSAPEKTKDFYVPGAKVKLLIKDLELSTKFLGAEEEVTLCEADCVLLGLLKRPKLEEKLKVDSKTKTTDSKTLSPS